MSTFLIIFLSILIVLNILIILIFLKNNRTLVLGIATFDDLVLKFIDRNTKFFNMQSRAIEMLGDLVEQYKKSVNECAAMLKMYNGKLDNSNVKYRDLNGKMDNLVKENKLLTDKLKVIADNIKKEK